MGAWLDLQILAMAATFAWFAWRTRGPRTRIPDPRERDPERSRLRLCLAIAFIGAGIGAMGLGVVLRLPAWVSSGFRTSLMAHGDIMAYGALLGLSLTYALLARIRGIAPLMGLDVLAPCVGVLVSVARVGCFIAGCDFGSVTSVPWAVHYPANTAAFRRHLDAGWIQATDTASLPVHPAQLYEALVGVAMVAIGVAVERRRWGRGAVIAAVAMTYAVGRFVVEGFRGDERGALGPLSTPQWISVTVVVYLALQVWARWDGDGEETAADRASVKPRP